MLFQYLSANRVYCNTSYSTSNIIGIDEVGGKNRRKSVGEHLNFRDTLGTFKNGEVANVCTKLQSKQSHNFT